MDMAERVSHAYESIPGLTMSIVTGSVARGLADASSDLDVYLSWEHLDVGAFASSGRAEGATGPRLLSLPTSTGYFEKYRSGDRLVDVESVTVETLADVATSLDRDEPMSPLVAKTMAGLRDAVSLRGAEQLEARRSRLTYSVEQGLVDVAVNLRQFRPPLAIYNLTLLRGDTIGFYARISTGDAPHLTPTASLRNVRLSDKSHMSIFVNLTSTTGGRLLHRQSRAQPALETRRAALRSDRRRDRSPNPGWSLG